MEGGRHKSGKSACLQHEHECEHPKNIGRKLTRKAQQQFNAKGNFVQMMHVWAAHVSYMPCCTKLQLTSQAEHKHDGNRSGSDE